MTFAFNAPKNQPRSNTERPSNVDYDAYNEHLFLSTTAGKVKSIPGYISGIYALGIQAREDAEDELNPNKTYPEGTTYFERGGKTFAKYPRKPVDSIALAIDIPSWKVDYSLYFTGESSPVPYRCLLNNTWFVWDETEGKKVQTVTGFPLSEMKHDNGHWGFARNSKLHQLAEAADLLDENGLFTKDRVGELLGKCLQFQVQVYLKPSTDGSRKYLNEKIKLAGVVPEGLSVPALDPSFIHGLNAMGENDPAMVGKIREVVLKTVQRATNYDEMDVKQVIEDVLSKRRKSNSSPSPSSAKPPSPAPAPTPKPPAKATPTKAPVKASDWEDGVEDEIPF